MDTDSEKMLLEVLRMARELVINEHTDRRAQLHNTWLYESDNLWKTRRLKLKYPDIPPYPTEQDVLERAQTLLKFLVLGNSTTSVDLPKELTVEESTPVVVQEEPVVVQEEPVVVQEEPVVVQEIEQPPKPIIKEPPTLPIDSSGRILPAVLKQIEKMRNKF